MGCIDSMGTRSDAVAAGTRAIGGHAAAAHSSGGDLPWIWSELEALRALYARAAPKPVAQLDRIRDMLVRLDPRDLAARHPQAEGILVCTLFELARWQATWPTVEGRSVPPASFGYLVAADGP